MDQQSDIEYVRQFDAKLQVEQIEVAQNYEKAKNSKSAEESALLDRLVEIVELRNELNVVL